MESKTKYDFIENLGDDRSHDVTGTKKTINVEVLKRRPANRKGRPIQALPKFKPTRKSIAIIGPAISPPNPSETHIAVNINPVLSSFA